MGFAPPFNYPTPSTNTLGTGVSASLDFPPSPKASICGFSIGPPRFKFGFILPMIAFPPQIPIPYIAFKLVCALPNPIDVSAGLKAPFGGGRSYNAEPDPDLMEDAA